MRKFLFFFFIGVGVHGWGQSDTTFYSDWEFNNINYNQIVQTNSAINLLDYSSGVSRDFIKKFRTDSLKNHNIVADDWIGLYHAFKTQNRIVNYEDSTFDFTKKLFDFWNIRTFQNEIFTIPIGVVFQEGKFIKDENYNQSDVYFSQNESNYGWNISENNNLQDLIETHNYFSAAILYDETIFDQEVILTFDTNFTVYSSKKINYLSIEIQGNNFNLFPNDSVRLILEASTNKIKIGVHFFDSTYLENVQSIDTDTNYFDKEEKSSPFTGGIHSYPESGDDLSLEFGEDIFETIITSPVGVNMNYRLRYGIIWGACNTSEKLNKPIFMLHGFRPNVQPWIPSLKKLYKKKMNFKGSMYGDDGFVDLLVKNGFDVVICRIDPGYQSIRLGARLLSSFMENVVEPQKEENNSKFENIVLGFSMGGHYWRNMLMYDEHEHLNLGANRHHHTRMWIPVDSPLEGANNPLAHQFAAKSVAEHPAGFPVFNIAYINMTSAGSQEQQRYDVNGTNGFDGGYHRFHPYRTNYLNEMSNTFYLGTNLTKFRGYPSATRNVAVSVGSNSVNYFDTSPNNVPLLTYDQNSFFPTILGIKHWEIELHRASFISSSTSAYNSPRRVFKRKIYRTAFGSTNILVNDHFESYNWYHLDNCFGSYLNAIKKNVNTALNWNSLLGFGANDYDNNQVFVPTLSSLAIAPQYWPQDMRYNLKSNKLMFDELSDDISEFDDESNFFGYPHLGRPTDYQIVTPMDAFFCDEKTYEHITLIDDDANQNDQSELITFLLNEIQPWYLDLQNQHLGKYARSNYRYSAKYEARNMIRTGKEISPKTPFGEYVVEANADLELKAGQEIHLTAGTHITTGAIAHLYIEELCYSQLPGGKAAKSDNFKRTNSASERHYAGLKELEPVLFSAFPNPNNGKFSVCFSMNQVGIVYAYTMEGKSLGSWQVENKSELVLQQSFYKGLVLLKFISNSGEQLTTKILIE